MECSGSTEALADALQLVRKRGTVVQVGMFRANPILPVNTLVAKEVLYKGAFRFDQEFETAAHLISESALDLRPLISAKFPAVEFTKAFDFAADRDRAMKVFLDFGQPTSADRL